MAISVVLAFAAVDGLIALIASLGDGDSGRTETVVSVVIEEEPVTAEEAEPIQEPGVGQVLSQYPLGLRGMGPVEFGAVVPDVEAALGLTFAFAVGTPTECDFATIATDPDSPQVMVMSDDGDIESGTIAASAVPDGASGSELLTYTPADAADADYRIIFETSSDQIVTAVRAGSLPFVEWDGYCSDAAALG